MDLELKDKIIIVSEGTNKTGAAIAKLLADENAIPVIIGRNESENLKLINAIENNSKKYFHVVADLAKPEECEKIVQQILNQFERIDGLINNSYENSNAYLHN